MWVRMIERFWVFGCLNWPSSCGERMNVLGKIGHSECWVSFCWYCCSSATLSVNDVSLCIWAECVLANCSFLSVRWNERGYSHLHLMCFTWEGTIRSGWKFLCPSGVYASLETERIGQGGNSCVQTDDALGESCLPEM